MVVVIQRYVCLGLSTTLLARRLIFITYKSDAIWKLGQLNHVAIAVPNLEKSTQFYKTVMGAQVSGVQVSLS